MRLLLLASLLATACSPSNAPEPEEPRQVEAAEHGGEAPAEGSIEERIRDDAIETLVDCDPETLEILLLEGEEIRASYLAIGCGAVYRYEVACTRSSDSRGGHGPYHCNIVSSEEVDAGEADELVAEARENDLDDFVGDEEDQYEEDDE